jgi:CHAD domain-containing protein
VQLRQTLASGRLLDFVIDLSRFIETRGWLAPEDFGQTSRLAAPLWNVGAEALDKRWRGARRKARGITHMSIERRHELRKELKKLRYAAEFLAPLHPTKRSKPFLKRLKKLQTVFGDLNDAAMLQPLLAGLDGPDAANPALQRASGWMIGSRMAGAEVVWPQAKTLWEDLADTRCFWR